MAMLGAVLGIFIGYVLVKCVRSFRAASAKIDTIVAEEVTEKEDDASVETLPVTQEDEANARALLKQTYGVTDEMELQTAIVNSRLTDRVLPGDFPNAEAFWAEVEAIAGVPSDVRLKWELDALEPHEVPGRLGAMRNEGILPRWAAPLVADEILTELYQELNYRVAMR